MPKKYILKSLNGQYDGGDGHNSATRRLETNLLNLSTIGIKWNNSLIKQMRGLGIEETSSTSQYGMDGTPFENEFKEHNSIAGQNQYIAFFDQSYSMRRDFLRKFAMQAEIQFVLDTIANEVVINDDMHYFAYPNTTRLRSILKQDKGKKIVDDLNRSFRRVYHAFHFNESNDAWSYVKKFLIDGFLAFEIIYDTDDNNKATNIIGFQELDPITIQPEIRRDKKTGAEYKVWIQFKGTPEKERVLLDTNVIYLSWAKSNFVTHLSYCENLIRSFNMLRTIENSRVIWNMQNAQKRIKIVVPIGTMSEQKAYSRIRQLEAYYKEDINVDGMSGEITVNGQPKFSFMKTFVFPSREGTQTDISELGVEGHDLNSTESLKWFWQRFMIETGLPKDRFNMFFDGQSDTLIHDKSTLTRDEYNFSLFVGRVRDIVKELLVKPMWNQFCLTNKEMSSNEVLRNAIGITFTEENLFVLAKERSIVDDGTNTVTSLSTLQGPDGQPVFSMKFLTQKYLGLTDDDWTLNEKCKDEDRKAAAEAAKNGTPGQQPVGGDMGALGMAGGMGDLGQGGIPGSGSVDLGPGLDMSGGAETPQETAPAAEAPAPEPPEPQAV